LVSPNRKAIVLVLDGLGVGAMPDAALWGDADAATLQNTARAVGGINLPTLGRLGLGNIVPFAGTEPNPTPMAAYGRMQIAGCGKDTTTGHWELMGVILPKRFPCFPQGFPQELLDELAKQTGVEGFLGNVAASGTEIIARLGDEHLRTDKPIVYTSADSVLQIAAHVDIFPLEKLYAICEAARKLMTGDLGVCRIIARPFAGVAGKFFRIAGRRDWSLQPPGLLLPQALHQNGMVTVGVGKVDDILAVPAFDRCTHTAGDAEGMALIESELSKSDWTFMLANLNDLDTVFGHRNNPQGFADALLRIDAWIAKLLPMIPEGTLLTITADHGNDPTTASTDHCREYVPFLAWHRELNLGMNLGTRATLADVAATIADWLQFAYICPGTSFIGALL
jgi:phosphopentomutase